MDCREVRDLLDAYALGAAEPGEARALEEHAADCVRCWEELSQAQRAAALLALSIPLERAPAGLEERILARAGRGSRRQPAFRLPRSLRRAWPAAAGAFAAAAAAALAFAVVLQLQVTDLRDENSRLEGRLQESNSVLQQQGQLMAVLAAPDAQEVVLQPTSPGQDALGVYYWSRASRKGFFLGSGLPALQEGQVYQVWFMTEDEAAWLVRQLQTGVSDGKP